MFVSVERKPLYCILFAWTRLGLIELAGVYVRVLSDGFDCCLCQWE